MAVQPQLLALLLIGDAPADAVQLQGQPATIAGQQGQADLGVADLGQQGRLTAGNLYLKVDAVLLLAVLEGELPRRTAGTAPTGQFALVGTGIGRLLIEQGGGNG